ncbi:AI-2E family transporter [Subtercola sp. PAMC28395]|uniref:AI-2E family transporter n=1 Tax=Subtercola sp. PAMC28395 TaxID=2846775 RepID=UPI001C0AAB46|nr:AI-2E family transporter [Subtercola sp. PAMC28395]QWT24130.1 AI-2E family transporter [Subtercola sp. PAMC28395]
MSHIAASGAPDSGEHGSPAVDTVGQPGSRYPRGTVILVGLAAVVVAAAGISAISQILAPVLLTLILTICANPVRTWLQKRGVPQGLATGSVILVVFALLAGFVYTLVIAFAQFVSMLPNYSSQFTAMGASIGSWLESIGIGAEQVQQAAAGFNPANILNFFSGLLGSVFGITAGLVIVLTMLILMSADAAYTPTLMRQLSERQPYFVAALGEYTSNVRRYMVVTTVLGVAQGVLNALALWIMGVPAALLWGILAFLCSFIPNIGYFFAIIPPIVFGYLVGGWPTVIAVVVVYGVINAVVQSIIQPRVVGNAVSLSQTITFFSVLFWAVVIGPIGAILAIPLTLMVRLFLIDSDPKARWLRLAIGDTTETRVIMKTEVARAKQVRLDTRATRKNEKLSSEAGPPRSEG